MKSVNLIFRRTKSIEIQEKRKKEEFNPLTSINLTFQAIDWLTYFFYLPAKCTLIAKVKTKRFSIKIIYLLKLYILIYKILKGNMSREKPLQVKVIDFFTEFFRVVSLL